MKKAIIGALIVGGLLLAGHQSLVHKDTTTDANVKDKPNVDVKVNDGMCVTVNGEVHCMGLREVNYKLFKKPIDKKVTRNWNLVRIVNVKISSPNAAIHAADEIKRAIYGARNYNDLVAKMKAEFKEIFGIVPDYPDNLWYTLAWNLYHVPENYTSKSMLYMNDFKGFAAGMLKPRNPDASYFGKTWLPG